MVTHVHDRGYHKTADVQLPSFGLIVSMRDPAFGKGLDSLIRAGALLASFRVKLKLVTEEHDGYKLVGYRFAEDVPLPPNLGNILYNFTPCFVAVGDQFAVSSTLELGRQLIPLLDKEKRHGRRNSSALSAPGLCQRHRGDAEHFPGLAAGPDDSGAGAAARRGAPAGAGLDRLGRAPGDPAFQHHVKPTPVSHPPGIPTTTAADWSEFQSHANTPRRQVTRLVFAS